MNNGALFALFCSGYWLRRRKLGSAGMQSLDDDELATLLSLVDAEQSRAHLLMNVVIPIGVALVYETDLDQLLERILSDAMNLCSADAGALYLRADNDALDPAIVRITSLGIAAGGKSGKAISSVPAQIRPVVAPAALMGVVVNTSDVAEDAGRVVLHDQGSYQILTCLALPLRNASGDVIGVVELANARRSNGEISPFEPGIQQVLESLCLIASAALESYLRQQKLKDQMRELSIKIDETKKAKQVSAIIETDYFKNLRDRAKTLRGEPAGG
jgi:transcriptional regulator with GAF, ATPase, and Fis domain